MSQKIFFLIALAGLLVGSPASAESLNAPAAAPAAVNALTPEQAHRALETLQDDAKRAQMIDTLRAIADAAPPATVAPEQKAAIPLAADSLGAQLLLTISEQIGETSREIADAVRTITRFPALWHWLVRTATDPLSYDILLDIAWKLALVFGCALSAEWLVNRAVRRPLALLQARIPVLRMPPRVVDMADPPSSMADLAAEPEQRRRRVDLTHLWQSLVRLPFVLGRLVLELLPVVAFAGIATLLLSTEIGDLRTTRLAILAIVNAYVICRGLISIARSLVCPPGLITVRAETAAYIEIWVRRIVTVGVAGIAVANVALLLGLHRGGHAALLRLVMLVVHLFVVVIILQCRRPVADAIRSARGSRGTMSAVRNRIAGLWHILAIAVVLALWGVWALNVRNGYTLLLQYFAGTIAVALITRLLSIVVLSLIDRGFRINPEILQRFPGLEARANRYLPLLRKIVSAVIAAIGLVALLEVWGVDAVVWFYGGQIGSRLLSAVVTIGIAALIAAAIWEASNALLDRQLATLTRDGHFARAARLRTFQPMLRTALLCLIVTVVALTALSEIGVNVAPLLGRRRDRRHRHRLRFAEAGAGRDYRVVPVAGERGAGGRHGHRLRAVRNCREPVDPDHPAAGRRRRGAYCPLQCRHQRHQCQPRRRQCRCQRQCLLQGRHRPGRTDPQGHRYRDARRARLSALDPRRTGTVGRRQGGRIDGLDGRSDPLHRRRTLAGAA